MFHNAKRDMEKATSKLEKVIESIKAKEAEANGKLWPRIGLLGASLPAKLNVNDRILSFPGWRERPLLSKGKEVSKSDEVSL